MTQSEDNTADRAYRIYPASGKGMSPGEVYADLEVPEGEPYTIINMVSTVDGRAAIGGTASVIGSETDRGNMDRIRSAVDAILSGSGTLRQEGVNFKLPEELVRLRRRRSLADQPLAVILTGSGDVPLDRKVFQRGPEGVLLAVPESLSKERERELSRYAMVRRCGGERFPQMRLVLRMLREEFGVRRLLCEGGPIINHALIREELADELLLTFAPKLSGDAKEPGIVSGADLNPEGARNLRLKTVFVHDSELYLRYEVLK